MPYVSNPIQRWIDRRLQAASHVHLNRAFGAVESCGNVPRGCIRNFSIMFLLIVSRLRSLRYSYPSHPLLSLHCLHDSGQQL